MHPIIERDVMHARVADQHRQAERDRIVRAASRTPRARQEKAQAEPHAQSHGRSRAPRARQSQCAYPIADAVTAREGIPMLTGRHPADQTAAPKQERRCLPSARARIFDGLHGTTRFANLNLGAAQVHQALTFACSGDPGAGHLAEQCCDPPGSQWLQAAAVRRVDPAAVNMLSHEYTAPHPRRRASFSASK